MTSNAAEQGRILSEADRERFAILYATHYKELRAIMASLLEVRRLTLDELMQETCAKAIRKIEQLQDDSNFLSWMVSIAKREFWMLHRKAERDKQHLEQYCLEKRSSVLDRMESHNPVKKFMKKIDIASAKRAIQKIDFDLRVVLTLSCIHDMTAVQIAAKLNLPVYVVEYRLKKVRRILERNHFLMLKDYLIMKYEKIDNDEQRPWMMALVNLGILNEPDGVQDSAVSTMFSHVLEAVNRNTPETTTAGAGTAASLGTFSTILMAAAFPSAWVMSFLIGMQFCGLAFVRNATSLPFRRWIVKQFLCGYFLLIFLPAILLPSFYWLDRATGMRMRHEVIIPLLLISLPLIPAVGLAYLFKTHWRYFQLSNMREKSPSLSYRSLRNLIVYGYGIATLVLIAFFVHFVWAGILPVFRSGESLFSMEKITFVKCILGLVSGLFVIFHLSMLFLFRYCLSISGDDAVFSNTTPVSQPIDWARLRKRIEWPCFAVAITISSLPHLNHLFVKNQRPVCSSMELTAYTLMWCLVFLFNRKTTSFRTWCGIILGAALLEIGVMAFLRSWVY